jgi:hypothetical protein
MNQSNALTSPKGCIYKRQWKPCRATRSEPILSLSRDKKFVFRVNGPLIGNRGLGPLVENQPWAEQKPPHDQHPCSTPGLVTPTDPGTHPHPPLLPVPRRD